MEQVPISMQSNEVLMSHIVAERLTILIWFNCPQNADGRNMGGRSIEYLERSTSIAISETPAVQEEAGIAALVGVKGRGKKPRQLGNPQDLGITAAGEEEFLQCLTNRYSQSIST
ncbi:hypothetical protein H2204_006084 [Knufia peltigerae]|uniref:Uncharacterized protein n=1 Tax=Knufia peltigerae TaxID=1002370 RepID=A0AA38Y5L8_9EURO|nr:hypothetical protein H2204_006084 [Knufia peltigerae]